MKQLLANTLIFFGIILFFFTNTIVSLDYKELVGLKAYDQMDCSFCQVTFVTDDAGNRYVVKQIKYDDWPARLARSVCEVVALDIGHSVGVPLNEICIIPAGVAFIGKKQEVPATLHTHVPGVRFDAYKGKKYQNLGMRQNARKGKEGLSQKIIYHMSRHSDLPAMAALDTFVCNGGRGKKNYFFDDKMDTFWGIDMASSFYKTLPAFSCENVRELLVDDAVILSELEVAGLAQYYCVLQQLVTLYNPIYICKELDKYAQLAGFFDDSFFDTELQVSCLGYFAACKQKVHSECAHSRELIQLLEQLLRKNNYFINDQRIATPN